MSTRISLKQLGPDVKSLLYYGNAIAGDSPVGSIISYMGISAPPNYLACDGSEYNISDYPHLTSHFLENFGSMNFFGGDGGTTFAVPDLQGEFLRGTGSNSHEGQGDGGDVGSHQNATLIPFSYLNTNGNFCVYLPSSNQASAAESRDSLAPLTTVGRYASTTAYTASATSSKYTTRPTNTSVLFCIKAKPTDTGHTYSYEERRVGTWVDGKPLYEKTIDFGSLPNATRKEVQHGIENVETIWIHDGFVLAPTTNSRGILNLSNTTGFRYFSVTEDLLSCQSNANYSSLFGTVVVRYTKTLD